MSISRINGSNAGRVVMVDIIELVNNVYAGDFGCIFANGFHVAHGSEKILFSKLRMDKPARLLESMLEHGFIVPVLVSIDNDNLWLDNGHHRLALALFCGFTEVPVFVSGRCCGDWDASEDENLPASRSLSDDDFLRNELESLLLEV